MKHILFPTDLSDESLHALSFSLRGLKLAHVAIYLLSVYHLPVMDPYAQAALFDPEQFSKSMEERLGKLRDKILVEHPQVTCEAIARVGLIVDVILDVATEKNVDLIVMGTGGAAGLSELLIGTNTVKVIQSTQKPVFAITHLSDVFALERENKTLAYAVDVNEIDLYGIMLISQVLKLVPMKVKLLHVMKEPSRRVTQFFENVTEMLRPALPGISFEILSAADVTHGLQTYLEANPPDVIAMTTHKKSFMEKLFNKSHTASIAYHSKIPLLSLPKFNV